MRFLAALLLLLPVAVIAPGRPAQARAGQATVSSDRMELARALEVLHGWDARREHAWATADPAGLRALYEPGSGAGRADLRLLRAYATRGLVVRRIVTQVFAVKVLRLRASAMRLRVFDRVAGGEVVQDGHAVALASSRPVTRDIDLRLGPGGWRVASISGSGSDPHAARR